MTKFTNVLMSQCANVLMNEGRCSKKPMSRNSNVLMNDEREQQHALLLREKSLVAASDMPSCSLAEPSCESSKRPRSLFPLPSSFFHLTSSIFLLLAFLLGVSNVAWGQEGRWCHVDYDTYNANGYTFTIPTGCTKIHVECIGAGGGGGSAKYDLWGNYRNSAVGGGGGGGMYSRQEDYAPPTNVTSLYVFVGKGGEGKSPNNNGGDGGTSFVKTSKNVSSWICRAEGGNGGGYSYTGWSYTDGTGGSGGSLSTGYTVIKDGGAGCAGYGGAATDPSENKGGGGGAAGAGSVGTTSTGKSGGGGGSSASGAPEGNNWLGGGTGGTRPNSWGDGGTGNAPGGGGSGGRAYASQHDAKGGSGADGKVRIWYFIPFSVSVSPTAPTICQGGQVTLTGTTDLSGATCKWTPGDKTTTSITVKPNVTTDYTVTYTKTINSGCTVSQSATATVTVLAPAITLKTIDNKTICKGSNTTLKAEPSATPTGTVTYKWTPISGLSPKNGQEVTVQEVTASPTTTTEYTVVATATETASSITCTKTDTKKVTVTVKEAPSLTITDNNTYPLCNGTALSAITVTTSSGATLSAGNTLPAGVTLNNNAITGTPTSTEAIDVNYTITATNSSNPSGCQTKQEYGNIKTYSQFKAGSINSGSLEICAGGQVAQITSNTAASGGNNDFTYQWYVNGQPITNDNNASGSGKTSYTPSNYANTPGTYTFTRRVKDSKCNTDYDADGNESIGSYTLKVDPYPEIYKVTSDSVKCNIAEDNIGVKNNGQIEVYARNGKVNGVAGTSALKYELLETGANDNNQTGVAVFAGLNYREDNYQVKVTEFFSNSVSCSVTTPDTIVVRQPSKLTVLVTGKDDERCEDNGWVKLNITGSHPNYKVLWQGITVKDSLKNVAPGDTTIKNLISQSYTITVFDNEKCYTTVPTQQTIAARQPWNPTYIPSELEDTVCNNTHFDISASDLGLDTVNGITYRWTITGDASKVDFVSPGAGILIGGTLNNRTGEMQTVTYHVIAQRGLYCYSQQFDVKVTVLPGDGTTVVATVNPIHDICPGSHFDIPVTFSNVTPAAGATAVWKFYKGDPDTVTSQIPISNGEMSVNFRAPIPDHCSGEYWYEIVVNDGSCSATVSQKVYVEIPNLVIPVSKYDTAKVACMTEVVDPDTNSAYTMPYFITNCGNYADTAFYDDSMKPVITSSGTACEGTVTYTYTYTSCNGSTAVWKYVYEVKDDEAPHMDPAADGFLDTAEVVMNKGCAYFYPDVTDINRYKKLLGDNCTDSSRIDITQYPVANQYIEPSDAVQTLYITLYLHDQCGNIDTLKDAVSFKVPASLSISDITENAICKDSLGTSTVTVTGGSGKFTYKWDNKENLHTNILNATAGSHYVDVVDTVTGCSATKYVTIGEPSAVTVVVMPMQDVLCEGSSITLYASASGGDASSYTYQWYKGGAELSGKTSSSLVLSNVSVTDDDIYSVVAHTNDTKNCPNNNTNNTSTITVNPLPVVSITPSETTICEGKTDTLKATSIAGAHYNWSYNVLSTTKDSIAAVNAGGEYTVTVSVSGCSSTATATVTVNNPRVVLNEITGQTTICEGGNTSLKITTRNHTSDTLKYQWYRGNTKLDGHVYDTLNNVTLAGNYKVEVTAWIGECSYSDTAKVTVEMLQPSVTTPTVAGETTICAGASTQLTVSATLSAGASPSYTWVPATGLNNTTEYRVTASPTQTTTYTVTVTATQTKNGVSCSASDSTKVTVNVRPAFNAGTIASTGQTVCYGSTGLTIIGSEEDATGGANRISYQWYHNGAEIANATDNTYTPADSYAQTEGIHVFTRQAMDSSCNTSFEPSAGSWTLTVLKPTVKVTVETPNYVTICAGESHLFTALTTEVNGLLSYKWTDANYDSLTNTQSYSTPTTLAANSSYTYHVIATSTVTTNGVSCSLSDTADCSLQVRKAFSAGKIVARRDTICKDGAAPEIGSINPAVGPGDSTYRWYCNGSVIADSTRATLVPGMAYTGTPGIYIFTRAANDSQCHTEYTNSEGSDTLVVQSAPAAVALNCPGSIQYNTNGTLSVRPLLSDETIAWTLTNGTGSASFVGATNQRTVTIKGDGVGTVTVTATIIKTGNLAGCKSESESCTITVAQNVMNVNCPGNQEWTYDALSHGINATDVTVTDANDQPITGATIQYSVDGGTSYSDTIPKITNYGSVQVTVRATHTQYDTNTCQFTMTVNKRELALTLTDCAAWAGIPTEPMESNMTSATVTAGSLVNDNEHNIVHSITDGKVTTNQSVGGVYTYNSTEVTNTATLSDLKIKDNHGIEVTGNYSIAVQTTQTLVQLSEVSHTDLSCHGVNSGEIAVTTLPRSTTYTYSYIYTVTNLDSNRTMVTMASNRADTVFRGLAPGDYRITVKIDDCSSNTVELEIKDVEKLTTVALNDTICKGDGTNIVVTAGGGSHTYTYEWRVVNDDQVISTQATTHVTPTATTQYEVTVFDQNSLSCQVKDTVEVNVLAPAIELTDFEAPIICKGSSTTLYAPIVSHTGNLTYQWYKEGVLIDNETDTSITVSPEFNTRYSVEVTATMTSGNLSCPTSGSKSVMVTVNNPAVTLNEIAGQTTVCYEGGTTLTVNPNNYTGDLSFQWLKGETDITSIANENELILSDLTEGATYSVIATATVGSCTAKDTVSATVTILHPRSQHSVDRERHFE